METFEAQRQRIELTMFLCSQPLSYGYLQGPSLFCLLTDPLDYIFHFYPFFLSRGEYVILRSK